MDNMTVNSGKKRILIVEDDSISMLFVTKLLTDAGFEIIQAYNGKMAVDKFKKNEMDFVFMDIQMPVMDGFTATIQIREYEKDRNTYTPIIALTAYRMEEDRDKCMKAGMDDFVSKPIDIKELMNKILKWIH